MSDADITTYFNQHKAEFDLIETQYQLAEIRVTDVPSAQPGNLEGSKATTDAEAKKKIQALKNRLDAGEDFGALAMNFSERPETASSGGDMGFVPESQMRADPAVFAAVMKLKAGADDGDPAAAGWRNQEAGGICDLQTALARAGGAARAERPPGAADDPATAAGWAVATAEECLLRDAAGPGEGGELLRRRGPCERREVRRQG